MLNSLVNSKFDLNDVTSMIRGHKLFLDRNTGQTNNAQSEHYVLNPEGVLSNNRHATNRSMGEGQPNGDATTEGQSLLILGFIYAYLATGVKEYLDDAIKYFDAYVNYFYADYWEEDGTHGHNPIPDVPSAWVSNWIINGKEPVDADYPLDDSKPVPIVTHGGFKGVEFEFPSNLQITIPPGAPYFGEYLDKATFAFDGFLGWQTIVASVYGSRIDNDGNEVIDWSEDGAKKGKQYDVDWIVDLYGRKVNWPDGNIIDANPSEPKGTIKLKPTYYDKWEGKEKPVPAGKHKLNFTCKVPVSQGGYQLPRNKPWHNRPVNVPVAYNKETGHYDIIQQMGNSSDSEQWFADVAYLLYKITGEQKYENAWKCVIFNTNEYSDIDAVDRFFRKSIASVSPWTDGISYDYFYPDKWVEKDQDGNVIATHEVPDAKIIRDQQGYIVIEPGMGTTRYTLEQQAVWYKVDENSYVSTEIGGTVKNDRGEIQSNSLNINVAVKIATGKNSSESSWVTYETFFPTDSTGNINVYERQLRNFIRKTKPNSQEEYLTMTTNNIASYGGAPEPIMTAEYGIVDERQANVPKCVFIEVPEGEDSPSDGFAIGLTWSKPDNPNGTRPTIRPNTMTYKSNATSNLWLSFQDKNLWTFHYQVPGTGGSWSTIALGDAQAGFANYQSGHMMPEIKEKDNGTSAPFLYYDVDIDGSRIVIDLRDYPNHTMPSSNYFIPGTKANGGNQWRWKYTVGVNGAPDGAPTMRPVNYDVEQYTLSRGNGNFKETDFEVYCFDELPPLYTVPYVGGKKADQFIMMYQLFVGIPASFEAPGDYTIKVIDKPAVVQCNRIYCWVVTPEQYHYETVKGRPATKYTYSFSVGDCMVRDYLKGNLKFTPGVIPFSNIYSDGGTETFDGWHGMPYPGYQYPFIWIDPGNPGFETRLNNMAEFLYESQQEYYRRYKILGPGMSAYIWNRWDNYKYGDPDSWTEYHWGSDHAWSGYQPRAFAGAARAGYELMVQNIAIPPKLTTYVKNWVLYLHDFLLKSVKKFGRPISPTEWYFPKNADQIKDDPYYTADGVSHPNPDDYTGHMNGLWLTGACFAALCDVNNELPETNDVIEMLVEEINYHYRITGVPNRTENGKVVAHSMDGSWTPSSDYTIRQGFGSDCPASFYGFWAGEILRGLGVYALYKQMNPGENMYDLYNSSRG